MTASVTVAYPRKLNTKPVALAHEHGFWIFEDDPYREVGFEGAPLPTMLDLDDNDRVIYASSFSKTVAPGVRVGYLAGPVEQIGPLAKRANETYISPNMLAESIVWELCRSGGLAENTELVKGALRDRRDALVSALGEHIPEAKFVVPKGGYFLWLTLHGDVDTRALVAAAAEEGVDVRPRPRLHARRRGVRAAALVRARCTRPHPGGDRAAGPGARPRSHRERRLTGRPAGPQVSLRLYGRVTRALATGLTLPVR